MQLREPSPDALVSFSDFLLERFGLVASMQVAVVASIALHLFVILGLGFRLPHVGGLDEPHNVMDVVLVNAKSATRPEKADALAQANLDGGGNTDKKLRAATPLPALDPHDPSRELRPRRIV
jgi:protein TonB